VIKLSEEIIRSLAPNQAALQNGWELFRKGSFISCLKSEDETVIFGECVGSGKNPYQCSVDFRNADAPVSRCSCPSRQFPCKHAICLMLAWLGKKDFKVAEIPAALVEKREKADKRDSGRKVKSDRPPQVDRAALAKKIKAQQEGLSLLDKVLRSTLRSGLGTMDGRALDVLGEQARQLGDYYLQGPQAALREFIFMCRNREKGEAKYEEALEHLCRLNSLVKKGSDYLARRAADLDFRDADSVLEESLGHAWQLAELEKHGLIRKDVELLQLSFNMYMSEARMEYVDLGFWADLESGDIFETRNYRPFKAMRHIREDDSLHSVVRIPKLHIYPGDLNRRVRWEEMQIRDVAPSDLSRLKSLAKRSVAETVKVVMNQTKNPLSAKRPAALLAFARIGKIDGCAVLEDEAGGRIMLRNIPEEGQTVQALDLLKPQHLSCQAMLVRFNPDIASMTLTAAPLSVVTDERITRLQ